MYLHSNTAYTHIQSNTHIKYEKQSSTTIKMSNAVLMSVWIVDHWYYHVSARVFALRGLQSNSPSYSEQPKQFLIRVVWFTLTSPDEFLLCILVSIRPLSAFTSNLFCLWLMKLNCCRKHCFKELLVTIASPHSVNGFVNLQEAHFFTLSGQVFWKAPNKTWHLWLLEMCPLKPSSSVSVCQFKIG